MVNINNFLFKKQLFCSLNSQKSKDKSSSLLIIYNLDDDIRTPDWIKSRLAAYGKITKITLVTKKRAAKVQMQEKISMESEK